MYSLDICLSMLLLCLAVGEFTASRNVTFERFMKVGYQLAGKPQLFHQARGGMVNVPKGQTGDPQSLVERGVFVRDGNIHKDSVGMFHRHAIEMRSYRFAGLT